MNVYRSLAKQRGYLGVGVRRCIGGAPSALQPNFLLPFTDAGAGAVNTAPLLGLGPATITRATNGTTWSRSGLLLTVLPGIIRSMYSELTGSIYLGALLEEGRTNSVIQNRDFTQAAWVMTTMTPLKDQVGIDGAANSASSLLATAGNATAAQTVTIAAVNRPFSVYIKRLVGTGNIDLAQDGASFTTQSVASDGLYHRCTLVASQLNPVLTIRLVTNGDKIAVDYAMLEDHAGAAVTNNTPGTPIATTTVAVTRNADILTYPRAGNMVDAAGWAYAEFMCPGTGRIIGDVSTNATPLRCLGGNITQIGDATNNVQSSASGAAGAVHKAASTWFGTTLNAYIDGGNKGAGTYDGSMNTGAIQIGGQGGLDIGMLNGTVKNLKLGVIGLNDGQIASL